MEEYVKTNCRTYNTCNHNEEDKIPEDEKESSELGEILIDD